MRPTRQRWTWLGPIRALLAAMIILDLLGLPVGALQLFHGAYPIGEVGFADVTGPGARTLAPAPASFGDVQLSWHPAGAFQILMFGLSHGLAFVLTTLPMLGYAYHVTGTALRDDPFTPAMVGKLRTLGLLILAGGLVAEAVAFLAGRALLDDVLAGEPGLRAGAHLGWYPSLWWLLPGLLVLVFAEVLRRGCDLRAELDEVI
jgi:hypothetical protein